MPRIRKFLADRTDLVEDLYLAASEIVDDFDDWGPVIQASADGAYDGETAIGRLRKIRDRIISELPPAATSAVKA